MKKSEAASIFQLSRNTIDLWLKRQAETGDYKAKQNRGTGNGHKITDWAKFREFVKRHGDKIQAEMVLLWEDDKARSHNITSLAKNWFHAKKKTYGYHERDEAKRQTFVEHLARIVPTQLVYVDEAGMDSRDDYAYGWNERGERFYALKSGRRQGRVNIIAALCNRKLVAPFTIEGACNRIVFETWEREVFSAETCTWASSNSRQCHFP